MQPGQFFTSYLETVRIGWAAYRHKDDKKGLDSFHKLVRGRGIIFALEGHGEVVSAKRLHEADLKAYGAARPPYSVVILEFLADHPTHGEVPHVVFVMDDPDNEQVLLSMSFKTIHKDPANWTIPAVFWRLAYDGSSFRREENNTWAINMHPHAQVLGAYEDIRNESSHLSDEDFLNLFAMQGSYAINTYLRFCVACHNYETEFADVEPSMAGNKMRRARGKVPLFTYKVLTIGKPKRKSQRLGGTHASPRSHLRRGCYRTSRNGVRHWVQPCMVKGDTDGFVHKDYIVEGQLG